MNNTLDRRSLFSSRKQAQLRKPLVNKRLRFSEKGFQNLKLIQDRYEQHLNRPISESVALDILLTKEISKYDPKDIN